MRRQAPCLAFGLLATALVAEVTVLTFLASRFQPRLRSARMVATAHCK